MDEFEIKHEGQPQNSYTPAVDQSEQTNQASTQPVQQGYYAPGNTPPVYNRPQMPVQNQYGNPGNYYSPNQYSAPIPPRNGPTASMPEDMKPKKKKNRTIVTIIVIVVVCVVIAIVGSAISAFNKVTNVDINDKPSQSDSNSKDDSDVKVEGSNEAAKTDADGNLTAAGVAQKTIDSCVGITVYAQQNAYNYFYSYGYGDQNDSGTEVKAGTGSGVIMKESNGKTYIMTAAHVISDGSKFTVTLNNDEEYDATVVGYDSQTDIGVLSINKTGLKVAKFGDSNDIEVGETCVAIGCPAGLEFKNSVTQGIVSALDRPVESSIGYNTKCIQVDAAINPGNSGGALFNMQGQVIGINSSKIASTEYEGMGFAVPSNTAVDTANSLIKNGYVAGRAKLGIEYSPLSNFNNASAILAELEKMGYKDAEGTMVVQTISDDSSLKNQDVKQYDMIVAVNKKTLTSTDIMTSTLSESKPGDTVTLTIARVESNKINTFEVKCKLIEAKE